MAKKTSVNLTTSDGTAFVLGASDVLLVLTEGTGSKVFYSRNGGKRRSKVVAEAPANIVTAHGGLIEVTDASDGGGSTTFWINGDRVVSIEEAADTATRATIAIEQTQDAVAQISTVTLTGNEGAADIRITGTGTAYTATFASDLATTADNFVTTHAADILADEDIVVTADSGVLTFTAQTAGTAFTAVSANASGDLDGTDATPTANVKEIQRFTPANVEVGDEFYVSCSGDTVSFTATAATVANVTGGLSTAIDAAIAGENVKKGGSRTWSTFDYDTTNSTDNTTNVTVTGASGYTFTAATANTKSTIEYDFEGMELKRFLVTDNVYELQVKLDAL